ncbi:DUF6525 family protein [Ruegeria haliotis]|nr:DUF6525 family protein [Ruegeria haliotis]
MPAAIASSRDLWLGRRTSRNLRTHLTRRKRQGRTMQAYDTLPSTLRHWLAEACLPWSPSSALKIWENAGGDRNPEAALERLDTIERSMLCRDARIWEVNA